MSRPIFARAFVLALVAVLALLPASALAAPPETEHFHDEFLVEDSVVCGIEVDIVFDLTFTEQRFFDEEGNEVRRRTTLSGTQTFTAENGKSLTFKFANASRAEPIVDEEAGTITFVFTDTGTEHFRTPQGGVVAVRSAGFIKWSNTFDLETFEPIELFKVIEVHGPHPEFETAPDFTLFCEVFTEALG